MNAKIVWIRKIDWKATLGNLPIGESIILPWDELKRKQACQYAPRYGFHVTTKHVGDRLKITKVANNHPSNINH